MTTVAADPMQMMKLVIESVPPSGFVASTTTDANGYLLFPNLDIGRYAVTDCSGHHTVIDHDGGPALWRFLGSQKTGVRVWSLVDASASL